MSFFGSELAKRQAGMGIEGDGHEMPRLKSRPYETLLGKFSGFSSSTDHCRGLARMYSRTRLRSSSLRTMWS